MECDARRSSKRSTRRMKITQMLGVVLLASIQAECNTSSVVVESQQRTVTSSGIPPTLSRLVTGTTTPSPSPSATTPHTTFTTTTIAADFPFESDVISNTFPYNNDSDNNNENKITSQTTLTFFYNVTFTILEESFNNETMNYNATNDDEEQQYQQLQLQQEQQQQWLVNAFDWLAQEIWNTLIIENRTLPATSVMTDVPTTTTTDRPTSSPSTPMASSPSPTSQGRKRKRLLRGGNKGPRDDPKDNQQRRKIQASLQLSSDVPLSERELEEDTNTTTINDNVDDELQAQLELPSRVVQFSPSSLEDDPSSECSNMAYNISEEQDDGDPYFSYNHYYCWSVQHSIDLIDVSLDIQSQFEEAMNANIQDGLLLDALLQGQFMPTPVLATIVWTPPPPSPTTATITAPPTVAPTSTPKQNDGDGDGDDVNGPEKESEEEPVIGEDSGLETYVIILIGLAGAFGSAALYTCCFHNPRVMDSNRSARDTRNGPKRRGVTNDGAVAVVNAVSGDADEGFPPAQEGNEEQPSLSSAVRLSSQNRSNSFKKIHNVDSRNEAISAIEIRPTVHREPSSNSLPKKSCIKMSYTAQEEKVEEEKEEEQAPTIGSSSNVAAATAVRTTMTTTLSSRILPPPSSMVAPPEEALLLESVTSQRSLLGGSQNGQTPIVLGPRVAYQIDSIGRVRAVGSDNFEDITSSNSSGAPLSDGAWSTSSSMTGSTLNDEEDNEEEFDVDREIIPIKTEETSGDHMNGDKEESLAVEQPTIRCPITVERASTFGTAVSSISDGDAKGCLDETPIFTPTTTTSPTPLDVSSQHASSASSRISFSSHEGEQSDEPGPVMDDEAPYYGGVYYGEDDVDDIAGDTGSHHSIKNVPESQLLVDPDIPVYGGVYYGSDEEEETERKIVSALSTSTLGSPPNHRSPCATECPPPKLDVGGREDGTTINPPSVDNFTGIRMSTNNSRPRGGPVHRGPRKQAKRDPTSTVTSPSKICGAMVSELWHDGGEDWSLNSRDSRISGTSRDTLMSAEEREWQRRLREDLLHPVTEDAAIVPDVTSVDLTGFNLGLNAPLSTRAVKKGASSTKRTNGAGKRGSRLQRNLY